MILARGGVDAAADRDDNDDDDDDGGIHSVDTSTSSVCTVVGVKGERVKVLSLERTSHASPDPRLHRECRCTATSMHPSIHSLIMFGR